MIKLTKTEERTIYTFLFGQHVNFLRYGMEFYIVEALFTEASLPKANKHK